MTLFDQFNFQQRSLVIQQLTVLVESLKESHLEAELTTQGLITTIGGGSIQNDQQKILEFCMNHFGQPYSHEASEG